MIESYSLHKFLAKHLELRGWPFPVHYGPTRVKSGNCVVIERNRNSGDTLDPNKTGEGDRLAVRLMGCAATVYAASGHKGAHLGDHETLCEDLVDSVHSGILLWAPQAKARVTITGGRPLRADELGYLTENPNWVGAAYQLTFAIGRGVFDHDSKGRIAKRYAKISDVETDVTAEN